MDRRAKAHMQCYHFLAFDQDFIRQVRRRPHCGVVDGAHLEFVVVELVIGGRSFHGDAEDGFFLARDIDPVHLGYAVPVGGLLFSAHHW